MVTWQDYLDGARETYAKIAPKIAQIGLKWDPQIIAQLQVDMRQAWSNLKEYERELIALKAPDNVKKTIALWIKIVDDAYKTVVKL